MSFRNIIYMYYILYNKFVTVIIVNVMFYFLQLLYVF